MKQIGRLAMRVEGNFWSGYYAMPDTMDGAIFLGSIQMRFVDDKDRKDVFMKLMREAVGDILEEATGQRPHWKDPTPAPEHERSGRA